MTPSSSAGSYQALPPGSRGEDFQAPPTTATAAGTVRLSEFLPELLDDVLTGKPPPEYHFDKQPWGTLALRPGQITCVGGPPNCGKTGLIMRIVSGALLLNPALRAVIACVEMDERILIERTLARLSGVFLGRILRRQQDRTYEERIKECRPQLESLGDRLLFVRRPFTMENVRTICEEFQPHIVALDYLQRIPADSRLVELRQQVTLTMTAIRELADKGPAVLMAAALNRQASSRSQSRAEAMDDNVNDLAAFRDSSDVEYSVDDAYVLAKAAGSVATMPDEPYKPKELVLRHVKSRNSITTHIPLLFDGRLQEFSLRKWQADAEAMRPPISSVPAKHKKTSGIDTFMEGLDGTAWLS